MKIYKVAYYSKQDSSQGFSFHSSLTEAKKALATYKREASKREAEFEGTFNDFDKNNSQITPFEFEPNVKGILGILNRFASHPDNG